ncbi:hypothetical protein ABEG18_20020 [Alsobacter sp. KACC 23698]|uniref:Uncharacterized protein n=1 Tax=Alsobacter sp. KACC 23698 TaxID=3149229 RepID=A0AAU7JCI5_9HYPH
MAHEQLSRIHELARMRARAALERASAAERRVAEALSESQAARDALAELAATQSAERAERIARILAGPASPARLARVGLQYDMDAEDRAAQERRIAQCDAAAAARRRDLERERGEARMAANRETKLAGSLERISRVARLSQEGASESDADAP